MAALLRFLVVREFGLLNIKDEVGYEGAAFSVPAKDEACVIGRQHYFKRSWGRRGLILPAGALGHQEGDCVFVAVHPRLEVPEDSSREEEP